MAETVLQGKIPTGTATEVKDKRVDGLIATNASLTRERDELKEHLGKALVEIDRLTSLAKKEG